MSTVLSQTLARTLVLCVALTLPGLAEAQSSEACQIFKIPPAFGANEEGATPVEKLAISASPHHALHGQLLYGEDSIYLSHLAVFMGDLEAHPHNFQVILEGEFSDPQVKDSYLADRKAHPESIYTAVPPTFDQFALVTDEPGRRLRRTLPGTKIVRGHFEKPGAVVIMPDADLEVSRIVHFREFITGGKKLETPHYLLFGRTGSAFLSHMVSAPPDFQQILRVELTDDRGTLQLLSAQLDAILMEGLYLHLPDRENGVADRLRAGETLLCSVDTGTRLPLAAARIEVTDEYYCEAGELSEVVMDKFNKPADCVN